MILGVAVYGIARAAGWPNPEAWIFFPLVVRAFGLLATIVAIVLHPRQRDDEDPMNILNRGYWVTTLLSAVGLAFATNVMMQTTGVNGANGIPAWVCFFGAGLVGLATSVAFVYITQYYTAGTFRPVQRDRRGLQDRPGDEHHHAASRSASRRPLVTAITIGIALLASHWLGEQAGLVNADGKNVGGIFGTAVATMGMLMTTAYILAMDTFGPITDNAGGIAEFSRRRGRRPRDHRPPRRGRQHDQGADQGLRHRLGLRWPPSCSSPPTSTRSTSSSTEPAASALMRVGRTWPT